MLKSLRIKVLFFWFASIVLTLGVVTATFVLLTDRYQERVAADRLSDGKAILERDLGQFEGVLTAVSRRLAESGDVQTRLNLLSRYQDPNAYQPLAFDPEKQALARQLRDRAGFGDNHILALVDERGRTAAFHIHRPSGEEILGYTTYEPDGTPLHVLQDREGRVLDQPMPRALSMALDLAPRTTREPAYRLVDGQPAVLISRPVERLRSTGENVPLGHVLIVGFLDDSFLLDVERFANSRLTIVTDGGVAAGPDLGHEVTARLASWQGEALTLARTPDFFWTAASKPLGDGAKLWFVFSLDSRTNKAELSIYRDSLIGVLIFTAFALLPLAYFLESRTLSQPIKALTDAVEAMRKGGYATDLAFRSQDELGVLAQKFNEMTAEIRAREDALRDAHATLEDQVRERTTELRDEVASRRRAESHLRLILDTAADAIITIDGVGVIDTFNHAAETIFGYRSEEVIGRNVAVLMEDDIASRHDGYLARYHETGEKHIIDTTRVITAKRKNGEVFPIELSISESHFQSETRSYTGIVRDITERKRIEKELIDALNAAEAANAAKSEFLSRMSHELRTPMNSIIGFAQLMLNARKEPLTEKQRQYLTHIEKGGGHLLELINEVLDLARIEAGRMSLTMAAVDVREIVEECLPMIEPLADGHGIALTDRIAEAALPPALADYTRLKQVLLNLISNAVKYNRLGGSVALDATLIDGEHLRIDVTDTGHGISEEHLESIFAPFNRLDADQTRIEGTGIGLTITKKLVESMNGRLSVRSRLGEGSTFSVELPLAASIMTVAAGMAEHDSGHGKGKP